MKKELKWFVYNNSPNRKNIESYNIFEHGSFIKEIENLKKTTIKAIKEIKLNYDSPKAEKEIIKYKENVFANNLKNSLNYYFRFRCEVEVVITTWPPYVTREEKDRLSNLDFKYLEVVNLDTEKKIDIYSQVLLNWNIFVDYVWKNLVG